MQGRLGKFCCVEPGPGSARTDKVRFGRIGEAGRVTDRTVEEWQARRCMSRICNERFGVAGMARWGAECQFLVRQARRCEVVNGRASPGRL